MEWIADPGVNEIVIICSAQSAKTLTILAMIGWIIDQDPGPLLWVTFSEKEAKKFSNMRLYPTLRKCAPVAARIPKDRTLAKTLELYLPGMPLVLTGADTLGALQSTPYRWLVLDEARSYKPGTLAQVAMRFRSYGSSYKKIIITTPADENDEVHLAWLEGSQELWMVPCPKCGHEHEMEWGDDKTVGGLKWDKTPETYDASKGQWKWDALEATIRYHCWNPECDHVWRDQYGDRKYISTNGRWVTQNEDAPSNVKSARWNALLPYWPKWNLQVREYLQALRALDWGDFEPYKKHITETRGQVWSPAFRFKKGDKYLEGRRVDYDPLAIWPEEVKRFMTVDVQGKGGRHYWYVIRAWAQGGWSRRIAYGKAYSIEELKEIAKMHRTPWPAIAIDSGAYTSEVYKAVVESGGKFKPMKGDDRWSFNVEGTARLYQVSTADPAIGTTNEGKVPKIRLWVFAKYGVLDRRLSMMHGYVGKWEIPLVDEDEEYALQVTAKGQRAVTNRRGIQQQEFFNKREDDHLGDCEDMQIVAAAGTNLLSPPPPPDGKKGPDPVLPGIEPEDE